MSFVFTDLQRFTNMSENMTPAELVALLQMYLGGLVDIAFEHGATIDKFVGDAIHVFFGAPAAQADHARRAMSCALAMDQFSETFRAEQAARGIELGITRIGVHTGPAVVGNVGGTRLFSYTAHGDVVNTSARLEVANKQLGTRICLSEAVALANPDVRVRPIGDLQLRGKSRLLRAYTPAFDVDEAPPEAYTKAFELLEKNSSEARGCFADLAERYPRDPLVTLHNRRVELGEAGTVIAVG